MGSCSAGARDGRLCLLWVWGEGECCWISRCTQLWVVGVVCHGLLCVGAGGDKPYLISGADDATLKIWDYQTKSVVTTLEGHNNNVTAVMFHPRLPIILSGARRRLSVAVVPSGALTACHVFRSRAQAAKMARFACGTTRRIVWKQR